jgi:hypothetical protein
MPGATICLGAMGIIALAASILHAPAKGQARWEENPFGSYSCGRAGRFDDFFGFDLQPEQSRDSVAAKQTLSRLHGGKPVQVRLKVLGRPRGAVNDEVVYDDILILAPQAGRGGYMLKRRGESMFRLRPPRRNELRPKTPGLIAFDADVVLVRMPRANLAKDFPAGASAICVAVQ